MKKNIGIAVLLIAVAALAIVVVQQNRQTAQLKVQLAAAMAEQAKTIPVPAPKKELPASPPETVPAGAASVPLQSCSVTLTILAHPSRLSTISHPIRISAPHARLHFTQHGKRYLTILNNSFDGVTGVSWQLCVESWAPKPPRSAGTNERVSIPPYPDAARANERSSHQTETGRKSKADGGSGRASKSRSSVSILGAIIGMMRGTGPAVIVQICPSCFQFRLAKSTACFWELKTGAAFKEQRSGIVTARRLADE